MPRPGPATIGGMPVSKGRKKAKKRPPPPPQAEAKGAAKGPSPTWYVALMFGLMGVGIVVILLNYIRLLPGSPTNLWLLVGLGGIGVGFGMTLNFR